MSVLVNSAVNIFPITNQRADSAARYLNEPHLVKWLLQLVDKKSFVTTPDVVINPDPNVTDDGHFGFFIDGYYLSVEQHAISEWIDANDDSEDIYAFLNICDDYVLGDNTTSQGSGTIVEQPVIAYVESKKEPLENYTLSRLFDTANGNILDTAKIVLNKNCKYFINFNASEDDPIELEYSYKIEANETIHQFKSNDDVVITGTLDQHIFKVTKIGGKNVPLSTDGTQITLTYKIMSTAFLGLELTTSPEPNPTVQLDSDFLKDTNSSTTLRILTRQGQEGSYFYIVPKESKLKFESYSINVDGGEV